MKTFLTLTTALVLGCSTMNAAHAETPPVRTLTVHFGDLDLNKAAGVDALYKRIQNAAESVCSRFEGRTLKEKQLYSDCVDTALATAVMRVDRPLLSRYLVERSRKARKASMPVVSSR